MSVEINKQNLTPQIETGVPLIETAPIPVQQATVLETNIDPIVPKSTVVESDTQVGENRGGITVSKEVGNDPHSGDAWSGTIENKKLGKEIEVL